MFGRRKQVFVRTMIGGMERRFEILDNQVNHIVFTHQAFDEHLHLCRNKSSSCHSLKKLQIVQTRDKFPDFQFLVFY